MPDPQARHSSYTSDSSPRSRKALKQRRFPSERHFQKHCNVQVKSTLKHQSLKKRGWAGIARALLTCLNAWQRWWNQAVLRGAQRKDRGDRHGMGNPARTQGKGSLWWQGFRTETWTEEVIKPPDLQFRNPPGNTVHDFHPAQKLTLNRWFDSRPRDLSKLRVSVSLWALSPSEVLRSTWLQLEAALICALIYFSGKMCLSPD